MYFFFEDCPSRMVNSETFHFFIDFSAFDHHTPAFPFDDIIQFAENKRNLAFLGCHRKLERTAKSYF